MSSNQVNYLNIGLMILSCGLAFVLPFELFLFSYAVLGPLHYLTEISWLHKRNYFTTGKRDYIWLTILCTVFIVIYFIIVSGQEGSYINSWFGSPSNSLIKLLRPWNNHLIFIAFMSALAMVVFRKWLYKLLFIATAIVVAVFLSDIRTYTVIIGVFLPTLMHVFLFTGAFILFGALKEQSVSGIISLVVFIFCGLSFFLLNIDTGYQISQKVADTLIESGFHVVNATIFSILEPKNFEFRDIFLSDTGIRIQQFIAFAYTYHYLNWFSKTSIIKWHDVPKKALIANTVIWIAAVALYLYNYKLGFIALLFLSMLHVLLEFPLNYRSFIGIGEEIGGLLSRRVSVARSTGKIT